MRINKIIEKLSSVSSCAILPEEHEGKIRLWMLVSNSKEKNKELRKVFPNLQKCGILFKLRECTSLSSANQCIARIRENCLYRPFRQLYLLPLKVTSYSKPKQRFGIVRTLRRKVVVV